MVQELFTPSPEAVEHLLGILEGAEDAIVSKDVEGTIKWWNPAAQRLFGYSPDEIIGKSIRTIVPPERQNEEDDVLRRIRAGERLQDFETIRMHRDGSRIKVSLTISPIRNSNGQIVGASKIARDISLRRLNTIRLEGERRAFELLTLGRPLSEVATGLINALEAQDDEVRASLHLIEESRLVHVAAAGLSDELNQLIDGALIGPNAGSCGTAAYRGETVIVEDIEFDPLWDPYPDIRGVALQQGLRACWSTPIFSVQGKVIGTIALYFSSRRKPSEAQMQFAELICRTAALLIEFKDAEETREYLSAIVNSSTDAIIGLSKDGMITSWNPGAYQSYGYAPSEIVGQPLATLVPEEHLQEFYEKFADTLAGHNPPAFDTRRLHKDGHAVDVSVKFSPVTNNQGEVFGISAVHRDISRQRSFERLQEEFLAMVTHELRNPLTVIKGFSSFLKRSTEINAEAVESIYEHSLILERLINDLLDASRVHLGKLALQRKEFDLALLLNRCCRDAQQTTSDHVIVSEMPSGPMTGLWDEVRIQQLAMNLLTNAIKYSPGGGTIIVRSRLEQSDVHVEVEDQGQGIASDDLHRIFERFVRAGARGSSRSLGLGLYVAQGIVEAHQGRIWAESAGPGRGATFRFTLPCV